MTRVENKLDFLEFLLTGSGVYGVQTNKSDIDIVLYHDKAEELRERIDDMGVAWHFLGDGKADSYSDTLCWYFTIPPLPQINIIALPDRHQFNAWKYATEEMKKLPPFHNRQIRIEKFRMFLGQFSDGGTYHD